MWNIQVTVAKENWDVMKVLRRSFLCSIFKENSILAKALTFWLAFFAERSYMGLKCQRVINMDTQKLFIFTIGDRNFLLIWILSFWILQKLSIFTGKILWFYFITSKNFFGDLLTWKQCLDDLHFLEIF